VPIRVGINGFGRIGRLTYRAIYEKYGLDGDVQVVAINDLTDAKSNAHLLAYDSNYGPFAGQVSHEGNDIVVDGRKIKVFAEKDPGAIPWGSEGVQIVVESTGFFTDATKAVAHKRDSVKKVVISAPAKNEDLTVVLGVNDGMYDPAKHHVISNASCTTNGLAPVAKVLHENFGIDRGLLTTVHAFTNSQRTVDTAAKDPCPRDREERTAFSERLFDIAPAKVSKHEGCDNGERKDKLTGRWDRAHPGKRE